MELTLQSGRLGGLSRMSLEIKKGSKTFQVEISDRDGDPVARVTNTDSDTEFNVFTKEAKTLDNLLKEIVIHLCDA